MASLSVRYREGQLPLVAFGAMASARFAFVALQFAVVLVVCWQFDIQNRSFQQILAGSFFAFLLHSALPLRWRAPFFLGCSFVAFWFVLGIANTLALVGIGGLLIALCHLPVSWGARVALLCAAGGVLAALRADVVHAPVSPALWPVLGSIFMFRLAVYLYDSSKDRSPVPLARRLSYFFLLPNAVFPFFPIIDFQTFQRNYYAGDPNAIYQRGVHWMARGVTHLVLYRIVYQHCVLAPEDVLNAADLAQYLLSTFLLYLQISGQFHLIVGLLHMFGFKLPETNHLYFLAPSITEFWRRINIYWKDFMMKTVYWPTVLRLRSRIGQTGAVVASTGLVFVVSWLLHSYQWFWLRGSSPLRATDAIFWGGLGLLAVISAGWGARPRRRSAARPRLLDGRLGLVLRTAGTFAVVCLLWSVWSANDLAEWRALWILPEAFEPADLTGTQLVLFAGVAALLGSSLAFRRGPSKRRREGDPEAGDGAFWSLGTRALATLLPLLVLGSGWLEGSLGDGAQFVMELRRSRLNKADQQQIIRGYYEELVHVEQFNDALFKGLERRPVFAHFFGSEKGADRKTDDLLGHELRPSVSVPWKLKSFSTNRWGMRDRDYELRKPEGSFRVAWLGSSHLMGWGVADDETFDHRLEERLNAGHPGGGGARFELLNFGVSDYSPVHDVMVFEQRALRFAPDAVVYVAHMRDLVGGGVALASAMNRGVDLSYEFLAELATKAGVTRGTAEVIGRKRLAPYRDEMVAWAYGRIAGGARARGIVPVWIYLSERADQSEEAPEALVRPAREAGFVVADLGAALEGPNREQLLVAGWDFHPNAAGHAILSERMYDFLVGPGGPLAFALRDDRSRRDVAAQGDPSRTAEPGPPVDVSAPPPEGPGGRRPAAFDAP